MNVLRDVSQNFDYVKEFINQRIEDICDRKKLSVEMEVIFL